MMRAKNDTSTLPLRCQSLWKCVFKIKDPSITLPKKLSVLKD